MRPWTDDVRRATSDPSSLDGGDGFALQTFRQPWKVSSGLEKSEFERF
jgi:hypothetical protein